MQDALLDQLCALSRIRLSPGERADFKAKFGADAVRSVKLDVTKEDAVISTFAESCVEFGGVDILVSNAGATPPQGKIGEVDEAAIAKSFELNFYGHQRAAQAAVSIML